MIQVPNTQNGTLLTEADVAQRLNLAIGTLQSWRIDGKGPGFLKLGRAVRYRPEDVESYIRGAVKGSAREAGHV